MYLTAEMRQKLDALPSEEVKAYALDLLERELTEERTDVLIALLFDRITAQLPWWAKGLAGLLRRALDAVLPEQLFKALRAALA